MNKIEGLVALYLFNIKTRTCCFYSRYACTKTENDFSMDICFPHHMRNDPLYWKFMLHFLNHSDVTMPMMELYSKNNSILIRDHFLHIVILIYGAL